MGDAAFSRRDLGRDVPIAQQPRNLPPVPCGSASATLLRKRMFVPLRGGLDRTTVQVGLFVLTF
jgi:hypothetical protein